MGYLYCLYFFFP
ncbi:hypothetical protein MXB_489 [Myxobolus squamalis]|nr:hypothetical protein MXB_489 [Myxobolus squamalis]